MNATDFSSEMYMKNHRYVEYLALKFCKTSEGLEWSDLRQQGALGMLRAVDKYDPARGPFMNFASILIRQAMGDLLVLQKRWKKHKRLAIEENIVSVEHELEYEPEQASNSVEYLIIREVVARLKPKLREVIEALYFDGMTIAALSRKLGITPEAIRLRQIKAMRQLREHLNVTPHLS